MATMTIHGIPVYNATITDEETGMFKISLVDDPAVMSNFLAFDSERKMEMYKVENDEKRLVRGVVMRADFPIYRCNDRIGEYYIIYTPEQIRIMAEKYLAESRQNDVNIMHEADSDVEGVQMVQYFIKGDGISVEGFDDISDGSLFAEFHILNDEVWAAIKDGTYRGFSLEGVFDFIPQKDEETLEELFSRIFNNKEELTMGNLKKFKAALLKALVAEFANVTTDKGILAWDTDEDLKAGDKLYIEDAEGGRKPAEDGEYKTEDGKVIVVVEGVVSEIKDPEAEVEVVDNEVAEEVTEEAAEEQKLASVATDKGELFHDGEGDLKAGDAVYVYDEEGNQVAAPDGDYMTEDGKTIKVAEGKVAEILDPDAEVAPEEGEMAALRAENEALKAEIAALKAAPMAQAAHEEVVEAQETRKTGVKGLDRLSRILSK